VDVNAIFTELGIHPPFFHLQSTIYALSIFRSGCKVGAFGATAPARIELKDSVRKTVITPSLALISLVPAYAQKTSATVNIPFSFTVDDGPPARRRLHHFVPQ
jgi:hypothetical protein